MTPPPPAAGDQEYTYDYASTSSSGSKSDGSWKDAVLEVKGGYFKYYSKPPAPLLPVGAWTVSPGMDPSPAGGNFTTGKLEFDLDSANNITYTAAPDADFHKYSQLQWTAQRPFIPGYFPNLGYNRNLRTDDAETGAAVKVTGASTKSVTCEISYTGFGQQNHTTSLLSGYGAGSAKALSGQPAGAADWSGQTAQFNEK